MTTTHPYLDLLESVHPAVRDVLTDLSRWACDELEAAIKALLDHVADEENLAALDWLPVRRTILEDGSSVFSGHGTLDPALFYDVADGDRWFPDD